MHVDRIDGQKVQPFATLVSAQPSIRVSTMFSLVIRQKRFIREFLIIAAGYFTYFGVRGATEGQFDAALSNAHSIVRLEEALGLFIEPALQAMVITDRWSANLANWVYLWGHWPVMILVGAWLYRTREYGYRLFRNAIIASGAIGLVLFMFYPVAPPRLTDFGFADTVTSYSNLYHVLQPAWLTNQFAAFPSLHFGWNLLIGISLIRESGSRAVRMIGLTGPLIMFIAIVLTANHYIVDAIGGGVVALVGLAIATKFTALSSTPAVSTRSTEPRLRCLGLVRRLVKADGSKASSGTGAQNRDCSSANQQHMGSANSLDRVASRHAVVIGMWVQ